MSQHDHPSGFGRFVAEMRRRHVVRSAFAYAAAAFVVLQLAEIIFPAFGIGEGGLRVLVVLTGLGFLPALVLAWVYDITTEGIRKTEDGIETPSRLAVGALLVTTVAVTGGLGLYLANQGVLSPVATDGTAAAPVMTAAYDPAEPIRSVAVLPLEDFSPSGDQAYFTSGMHEELIAKLSLLDGLRVVSRTTVMRYADPATRPASPQIGRELGVDALIEGSVTRSDTHVRVTLQVIHAASDSHIATLQWEREDVDDLLAFQTEIAHAVVDSIVEDHDHSAFAAVKVASADPEAQDAFLRGRYEYDRGTEAGLQKALEYFEDAVQRDPEFAAAMAGAASARFLMGLEDPDSLEAEIALARDEALKALEMDTASMEAIEVLGLIESAMPEVAREVAVPAPPDDVTSRVIVFPGGADSVPISIGGERAWTTTLTGLAERIDAQLRSRGLAAPDPGGRRQAIEARQLINRGRYADAAVVLERVVEEAPEMGSAWEMLARAHVATGDTEGAERVVIAWHQSGTPDAPDQVWVDRLHDAMDVEGTDGYWEWRIERLEAAEDAGRPVQAMDYATAYAALGDEDTAIEYLVGALQAREVGLFTLRTDPVWDDLRGDERFRRILREVQAMRYAQPRRPPGGYEPR